MKGSLLYHKRRKIISLSIIALVTCSSYVFAAPASVGLPNSGAAVEGAKPPAFRQSDGQPPSILVERQAPSPQENDNQQKISVSGFRISGELPVPEQEVLRLVQSEAGKDITLGRLNTLAGEVSQYLRHKGYLVAFAYIPAQDIKDGIVEIIVIPGKYGEVKITGDGHHDHDWLKDMLFVAKPGMLISDLNGVSVKATLTPGKMAGTANVNGALYADNWGNRYTRQLMKAINNMEKVK